MVSSRVASSNFQKCFLSDLQKKAHTLGTFRLGYRERQANTFQVLKLLFIYASEPAVIYDQLRAFEGHSNFESASKHPNMYIGSHPENPGSILTMLPHRSTRRQHLTVTNSFNWALEQE
jgi:hypothetical protein